MSERESDVADIAGMEKLWVVVPAYNEASVIESVIRGLQTLPCRIVLVDDGSEDGTSEAVAWSGVIVLRHAVNLGQGAALQTGITYCLRNGAEYVCTFDADGQHSLEAVGRLFDSVRHSGVDVVLGSRNLGSTESIPWARRCVLLMALWFTRLHTGLRVTDTHNGLRVFTADAARKIRLTQPRMAHASEILSQIASLQLRFVEVPVTIRYTSYSLKKGQSLTGALKILLDLFYSMWSR